MRAMKRLAVVAVLSAVLALAGCSGWDNTEPGIVDILADGQATSADEPLVVAKSTKVAFSCHAWDRNADDLTYTWSPPAAASAAETPARTTPENVYEWTAPTSSGTYAVTCTVTDGRGGIVSAAAYVKVIDPGLNTAPTATVAPAAATVAARATSVFVCTASDVDTGDTLTLAWFAGSGTVTSKPDDTKTATYTAPAAAGADVVYCIVGDGKGGYTTAVAKVTVTAP